MFSRPFSDGHSPAALLSALRAGAFHLGGSSGERLAFSRSGFDGFTSWFEPGAYPTGKSGTVCEVHPAQGDLAKKAFSAGRGQPLNIKNSCWESTAYVGLNNFAQKYCPTLFHSIRPSRVVLGQATPDVGDIFVGLFLGNLPRYVAPSSQMAFELDLLRSEIPALILLCSFLFAFLSWGQVFIARLIMFATLGLI